MPKSVNEIMNGGVSFVSEDVNCYYIRPSVEQGVYDNVMWKVDKKTGKIDYIDYTTYIIDIMENAKEIDPDALKRAS